LGYGLCNFGREVVFLVETAYQPVFEHCIEAIMLTSLAGKVIAANPAMRNLLGYTEKDIIGSDIDNILGVAYSHALKPDEEKSSYKKTLAIIKKDGTKLTCEILFSSLQDEFGNPVTCLVVSTVNGQNYLEHLWESEQTALRTSHKQIKNVFDSISEGIAVLDHNLRYILVNKATEKYCGIPASERLGKVIWDIYPELINSDFYKLYQRVLTEKKYEQTELSGPKTGRWFEHNVYPFGTGIISVYRDITDRKLYELEAARLDRLKLIGLMAAGISHEVRNPLTTVRGYLQLLSTHNEYKANKEQFDLMISELDRANAIISEFLSISKVDKNGRRQLQNLNDIINSLEPLLQAQATIQGKAIIIEIAPTPDINLDGSEIRQLILNIVNNGLEAMESGSLTIKTFADHQQVTLSISDQGPGIPPELLDKLGTPFLSTKKQGTGLGLAVCYGIVKRHGADINVSSSAAGTTFFIKFPLTGTCSSEVEPRQVAT
jgi:PAS domain S-box-containing protein